MSIIYFDEFFEHTDSWDQYCTIVNICYFQLFPLGHPAFLFLVKQFPKAAQSSIFYSDRRHWTIALETSSLSKTSVKRKHIYTPTEKTARQIVTLEKFFLSLYRDHLVERKKMTVAVQFRQLMHQKITFCKLFLSHLQLTISVPFATDYSCTICNWLFLMSLFSE